MATRVTPSQLNFNQIKETLKEFLKNTGEFNDYNFEGSGLSSLLDALAYDTHLKALLANFSLNEAFLDSAQLRASIVSHAKSLNYLPGSRNSAQAIIDVTAVGASDPGDIILPKYSLFRTTIDDTTYSFYTLGQYSTNAAANYVFEDVNIFEGSLITKRFIVDADTENHPIYVIPSDTMYVDSLEVVVRDGLNSTSTTAYTKPTSITDLAPDSPIYFLAESSSGYYELSFGANVVGLAPPEGSIVEVTFLSSSAAASNGAASFSTTETVSGNSLSISVGTTAFGGAERETIESIRFNAPKAFSAQDRAVTVEDFKALILNSVTYVETLNVYGGQDAIPPEYGKVFIAIKPVGAETLNETQKAQLLQNVLNDRIVLSITPEFIDPEIQYLEIVAEVDYNDGSTSLTQQQLETAVQNTISSFGTEQLIAFGSTFRRSQLTTVIDDSDASIISSNVNVRLQRRFIPTLNVLARYDLAYTESFASVTSQDHIVTSDPFSYVVDNVTYTCFLRNKKNSTVLEVYRTSDSGDIIVVDDAGVIDTTNNIITIIPFRPSAINDAVNGIRVSVVPLNEKTISPDKNVLLRFDENRIAVTASRDVG